MEKHERVILHCDANSFYASCELAYQPQLRGLPVCVGGDPQQRHGIVLAASKEAKRAGVRTAMVLWQAKQLCPQMIVLPPNFGRYIQFSNTLRSMYEEYTDKVEMFGLDEGWMDISNPGVTLQNGKRLADTLRKRAWEELGLTLSIGVSWNKVFAKLGSDYKKPDATTVIGPDNYRQIVWPLPASDLLFVGPKTMQRLQACNLKTIGDLARPASLAVLRQALGKNGETLHIFAAGTDDSPVMASGIESTVKSIGNSTTTPQDIATLEDVKCVVYLLAESVASRLRESGLEGQCVSISLRDKSLHTEGCQRTLKHPTALADEIAAEALHLFAEKNMKRQMPLRSLGVCVSSLLSCQAPRQTDLLGEDAARQRKANLAKAVDSLRYRFGTQIIQRGVVLSNRTFAGINPHDDHTVHPWTFYTG